MADIYTHLLSGDSSKGKAAMPKPTYCNVSGTRPRKRHSSYLGQSKLLPNGICETTEKALEQDRKLRASLKAENDPAVKEWFDKTLRKRENIVLELEHRLTGWNNTKCHACNASLKGWGPQTLNEQELAYFEDPILFNERAELAALGREVKDTKSSDAMTRLRELLARK